MKKKITKFNGVEVSKKEYELIKFINTGSHDFWDAYYIYKNRKLRFARPTLTIMSWFNNALKRLQSKKLCLDIPFVLNVKTGFIWFNPGIKSSAANFECYTIQEIEKENNLSYRKIL